MLTESFWVTINNFAPNTLNLNTAHSSSYSPGVQLGDEMALQSSVTWQHLSRGGASSPVRRNLNVILFLHRMLRNVAKNKQV